MEPNAENVLIEKIKSAVNADLAEFKTANPSIDVAKLTALENTVKGLSEKSELTALKTQLEEIGLKVVALSEQPAEKAHPSLYQALKSAFEAKKSEIDAAVKGNQTAAIKISVKAVDTMSVGSTIGSGATQVTITQNTGIISTIRKRELSYLANVSVGGISTNRALWIEETDEEGTPIMLGEGAEKTQLDVQYVEQTKSVKKIAVFGKVSTEIMADIPQLISYIQNNLMKKMDIVLEKQYFFGNDVGDNLAGLNTYATPFSAGDLADTIVNANEFDVLEAVALQSKLAFGQPNAIFVNPSTVSKMKLIKDSTGVPVWKGYTTITGDLVISGLRLVETTAMPAGDFLGGDLSVAHVLIREELGIQIGLDGNDFTRNKKTMLMEKRAVQFVSANDVAVIVKGSFATAIIALDTVA